MVLNRYFMRCLLHFDTLGDRIAESLVNILIKEGTIMDQQKTTEVEAAVFRRLLAHLDANKDVQNIDLMILANFCRNCLSKWYMAEAKERGESVDYDQAREIVYGMPYGEWKENHQLEATPEQLEKFENRQSS